MAWPSSALAGAVVLATIAVGCFPSPRSSVPGGGAGGAGGAQIGLGGNGGAAGIAGGGGTTGGAGAGGWSILSTCGDSGACVTGGIASVGQVPGQSRSGALPDGGIATLIDDGFEVGGTNCNDAGTVCVTGAITP